MQCWKVLKEYCETIWKQINNIIRKNRRIKRNIDNKINNVDISCESMHYIANVLNLCFVNTLKHISEWMDSKV